MQDLKMKRKFPMVRSGIKKVYITGLYTPLPAATVSVTSIIKKEAGKAKMRNAVSYIVDSAYADQPM